MDPEVPLWIHFGWLLSTFGFPGSCNYYNRRPPFWYDITGDRLRTLKI